VNAVTWQQPGNARRNQADTSSAPLRERRQLLRIPDIIKNQQSSRTRIKDRTQALTSKVRIGIRCVLSGNELDYIVDLPCDRCRVLDVAAYCHQVYKSFEPSSHAPIPAHHQG
jgi:hypothetical protein